MKKENLKNEIKELLLNDLDVLRDVVNELNSWNSCLDYLDIYDNDAEFFRTFFKDNPIELARAICYGDFNIDNDYVRFNSYGNLETLSEYDYEELLKENIEEIIDCLIDYFGYIDIYNSKLDILLSKYFEEKE